MESRVAGEQAFELGVGSEGGEVGFRCSLLRAWAVWFGLGGLGWLLWVSLRFSFVLGLVRFVAFDRAAGRGSDNFLWENRWRERTISARILGICISSLPRGRCRKELPCPMAHGFFAHIKQRDRVLISISW